MDIVDHGPAFIASVIKYIGLQLADVADPTGDLLLHQMVTQQGQSELPTEGEGDTLPPPLPNTSGGQGSRSARLLLPALPEEDVVSRGSCGEGLA